MSLAELATRKAQNPCPSGIASGRVNFCKRIGFYDCSDVKGVIGAIAFAHKAKQGNLSEKAHI
jgi:hypothetical protein